jgi:serine/threonine protein kinase
MAATAPITFSPAALQLAGRVLKSRWQVDSLAMPMPGATGGRHSVCYNVTDTTTGKKAFLKAIDYTTAFALAAATGTMVATVLTGLAGRFKFEQELLEMCRDATMRHVVTILDAGSEIIAGTAPNHIPNVDYIIFEHADTTVRNRILASDLHVTESLLVCRQCAVALQELHRQGIFHQDVKPSNLLLFPKVTSASKGAPQNHVKLGDLGRASHARKAGPFDQDVVPGDRLYMPFDQLYSGAAGLAADRRMIDGYSLGCVLFDLLTGQPYIQVLANNLQPNHLPVSVRGGWTGSYKDVKGYVDAAHAKAMVLLHDSLQKLKVPDAFIDEIMAVQEQLIHTDPQKRGHPKNRATGVSPCDMERYISQFDHLVNRAFVWGL